MAITITKGYTFTTTEQVTSSKLHQLVDSATVSLAAVNQAYVVTMASGDVIDITNSGTGDSIEINSSSTGCCIDLNKTGTGAGTCIDVANGGTGVGIDVNQTANGVAVEIDNDGTQHSLYIHQDGVLDASNYALYVYSNATQNNSPLAYIKQDGASSDQVAFQVYNDGTGSGVFIDQNGNNSAIYIDTEVANDGYIIKFDSAGANTGGIMRNDDVTAKFLLNLGNGFLWIDATGDLRVHSSYPSGDTDGTVVGSQS